MHLTDDQLNEYLDNEIKDRAQAELHLSSCDDCAARLAALQALFNEIQSLPEVTLSRSLAAPLMWTLERTRDGVSLPRPLRWAVILQAASALAAVIIAAPFIADLLPAIEAPSFTTIFLQIQTQWLTWLELLSTIQTPALPEIPVVESSSWVIVLTLAGASVLWLLGNGLLLRNQIK